MDSDGIWCSGVNTVNMTGGNSGIYLNSTFSLTSSANIPDTVWTGLPAYMDVTTNDPNASVIWDFGDSSSDTLMMTSHTYNTPGVVSVTVIISNGGCSDTISQNVMVMLATSTPRIVSLGFDVFPNPSTGLFNVKSPSAIEKEIEVYNVLGETVFTYTYTGNTTTIDLSNFEKGVYFIRIRENVSGGKNGTKRIIIE
jgi:PKD repeat protein